MKTIVQLTFLFLCLTSILLGQKKGSWSITDSMHARRMSHAGLQLDNGNVLVTGGYTFAERNGTKTTEIFDISTMKWNTSAQMNKEHTHHDLIKLNDGSVLAIGGFEEASCELFSNGKWTYTDSIKKISYYGNSAVLLSDGNALLTGGYMFDSGNLLNLSLKDCEIYSYKEGKWNNAAELNTGRFGHTSTLLQDGRVLVAGGETFENDKPKIVNTCEIFDPVAKKWSYIAPMKYARKGHSATLLSNGKVIVVGGMQPIPELYDPISDRWDSLGQVYLSTGHNRAFTLSKEGYLLLVHDIDDYISRHGWELYSLKDFKSLYHEMFERYISDEVIVKVDDNRVFIAGGNEIILSTGDPVLVPSQFCQMYDITLTNVNDINNLNEQPKEYILYQNYPNPFNSLTRIKYYLPEFSYVVLKVYDILGNETATLVNEYKKAGAYEVNFDAGNLPSGLYLCRLEAGKYSQTKKIILLK